MIPQSARILITAGSKPAVPLEDCQREYGRATRSASPRSSRYTGPSSLPPSCTVQRHGSLSEADQATGAVSPTLLALYPWHQMQDYMLNEKIRKSQPIQHRVQFASCAAALGWPRHKNGRRRHAQSCLLQQAPRIKLRSRAPRKRYKDQLERQLAQAGINHQSCQQEASDRDSWRSSARKASGKLEAERHEAAKEKCRS